MKIIRYTIACISISFTTLQSCKDDAKKTAITTKKIVFKHEGNLQFLDSTNTIKKEIEIEIADNSYKRETGLMYRKEMKKNRGMLFVFDNTSIRSFYMKNTYIPLDLIFIDDNNKIVHIAKHADPLSLDSILSEKPAKYVLEINAGLSDKWKLNTGDNISYAKLQ